MIEALMKRNGLKYFLHREKNMLTCFIRYQIDPTKKDQFIQYAQNWGEAIPRNGANLVGYFAPHEGSSTLAYGVYHVESLAAYERYPHLTLPW